MYLVIKYEFSAMTNEGNYITFKSLELMSESNRDSAISFLDDHSSKIDSVQAYVGEEDDPAEVTIYLDNIRESLEKAKKISEKDAEAFIRILDGTTFGDITWAYIEDLIYDELDYDEDEEDEWEAAARECS